MSDQHDLRQPLAEAIELRQRLVDAVTDALVEFDREQHQAYGDGEFSERLSRIARVNDAHHAVWAVLRVFGEASNGLQG